MTDPHTPEPSQNQGPWYMRSSWFVSYEWSIFVAVVGGIFGLCMLIVGIVYFANGSDDPQFGLFQTAVGVLFLAGNVALLWALRRHKRKYPDR